MFGKRNDRFLKGVIRYLKASKKLSMYSIKETNKFVPYKGKLRARTNWSTARIRPSVPSLPRRIILWLKPRLSLPRIRALPSG